jgi:hypothetical protein
MHTHCFDIPIRVLVTQDKDGFTAHALEIDLVGCGDSYEEAISELEQMISAQIGFVSSVNDPGLLNFRAPQEFFDRWEAAHAAALKGITSNDRVEKWKTKATSIAISEEEIKKARTGKGFKRVSDKVLA